MNTDKVSLSLVFESLLPKETLVSDSLDYLGDFINDFKSILMTGPSWEFNPTCSKIYKKAFEIDDDKLVQFLKDQSLIKIQELDIKKDFVTITIPVELLLGNVKCLPDDLLLKSDGFLITTMFGEITL